MGRLERKFFDFYKDVTEDIYKFCQAINFEPTFQQRWVLDAVQKATMGEDLRRIAVKSGQGPGKTAISTVVGLWRSIRTVDALTIVTAPTMRQCRDVWLMEARRRMANADPMLQKFINITKTKIEIAGRPDWGVKLVTATREENAQGYHQENLTVIAEEASGIPREIITQFKGTLSNPDDLFLMIGNPNTRDCDFFNCFNSERDKWITDTFNCEDTARLRPDIVNPRRNKDLEEEFGRDSDVYRIRVLGEFPHSDPNCVLSSEDLERITGPRFVIPASRVVRPDGQIARQFGIDFARFGGDESTIYRRTGNAVTEWQRFTHVEPTRVVDEAFKMQHAAGWSNKDTWFVADAGGMGQGIMFRFYEAQRLIFEFHNGGKAANTTEYENKITEAWFNIARRIRTDVPISIPKDNRLIQQLCNRQYYTTRKGKLVLETKDEYMKRGHDSPDRADGIVMSFYDNMIADARVSTKHNDGRKAGIVVNQTLN